jgi:hypothetical protein
MASFLQRLQETKDTLKTLETVASQSFSDIVLEAAGINLPELPFPTQEEVNAFFVKIGDTGNKLNILPPTQWSELQFLEWKRLVRQQAKREKVNNEAKKSPKKLKEYREKQKAKKAEKKEKIDLVKEDVQQLEQEIPQDQKPKGVQKLPNFLTRLIKTTLKISLPLVFNMIREAGIEKFEETKLKLLEDAKAKAAALGLPDPQSLSTEDLENLKQLACPTPATLQSILDKRNSLVNFLNNQQTTVDNIKGTVTISGDLANFLQQTSEVLTLTSFIVNQAVKVIPLVPGVLVSVAKDIDTINESLKFDFNGEARLPKLQAPVSNISVPVNMFSNLVTKLVAILGAFDQLITTCNPELENSLVKFSDSVLSNTANQVIAEGNTYKGFRLEIETFPYTDTVNRNRAVGKNADGITLIATELSFASDPTVLIDELKLIIDRDNLKAY